MDIARRLVPAAIRRRYAVKFAIALLILGLSVGLIGFVATAEITKGVEERVEDDQTAFASQEAQGLQMWNEQNERTLSVMARSDVVAGDDPAAIQTRFLEWEEHLADDTFAISYVDTADGTVLASTDAALRERPVDEVEGVDVAAYEAATEHVPWVSSPYVTEGELGEEAAVITYVLSVPDAEDRAIVYTAELESYDLEESDQVTTVVVDGNDEVILDNAGYGADVDGLDRYDTLWNEYDDASITGAARTDGATTRRVPAGTASLLDTYGFGVTDEEYVVSSARVYGTDWVVVTHEPESQAFGFVHTVNEWGHYATAGGVLMIALIGAVLGRNTAVSIDRLTRKAREMEEGNLDVDLETERIDNIGRLYDGFNSMRVALREQIEEAEAAREEAERERRRVEEINDHLERKADEYSDVMESAAEGDLTARMDPDGENEAMEAIADDFNGMLEEIEATVAELSRFATDVATASEQVTASSEEVQSASEQVTESIQEISDGAERQNQSLQSVNQEMSGLSTTTEEIAASSNEVADIAERTVDTGQEGREAAKDAIAAMEAIETEAEDAVAEMRRLEEEVGQIDQLIATISEIARQTNMLALNANIEASRSASGDDEEGFAVVAQEVKALSEDVANAADEAEKRLEAIRERTEQSTAEVEGTSDDIEDASERVKEAVDALEEIAELARETNVGVQEISAATEEQAASTQEVVAIVDDAATISETTTTEAENVAAAAEEQTTALTEVTKAASNLSSQSTQLSEGLDRFETDADGRSASTLAPSIDRETDDEPTAEPTEGGITVDASGEDAPVGTGTEATDADRAAETVTTGGNAIDELDLGIEPSTGDDGAVQDPAGPEASTDADVAADPLDESLDAETGDPLADDGDEAVGPLVDAGPGAADDPAAGEASADDGADEDAVIGLPVDSLSEDESTADESSADVTESSDGDSTATADDPLDDDPTADDPLDDDPTADDPLDDDPTANDPLDETDSEADAGTSGVDAKTTDPLATEGSAETGALEIDTENGPGEGAPDTTGADDGEPAAGDDGSAEDGAVDESAEDGEEAGTTDDVFTFGDTSDDE